MSRMWKYTYVILPLWVVDAELRRFFTFYGSSSVIDFALASVPLLGLLPYVWSLTFGSGWRRLPVLLSSAAWIWIGGFLYALVIAVLGGYLVAGIYDFVGFVLPPVIGLWIAADQVSFTVARQRITRLLFGLATATSVYGIFQYVVAPAWDVAWLRAEIHGSHVLSYGLPVAFGIRVWSTFLTHHAFANFLAFTMLLALPELSLKRPLLLLQLPIWIVGFVLPLYRTAWLVFAVGALVYLLLSPRRAPILVAGALCACILVGVVVALPSVTGSNDVGNTLSKRFSTFSDLQNDDSAVDRRRMYSTGFDMIREAPMGFGLGSIITTKASDKDQVTAFDSGYLGRLVEMGYPGFALYLSALAVLLFATIRLWFQTAAKRDQSLQAVAAMAVGCNVALLFEQTSFEALGPVMLTYWCITCLAIRALRPDPKPALSVALA